MEHELLDDAEEEGLLNGNKRGGLKSRASSCCCGCLKCVAISVGIYVFLALSLCALEGFLEPPAHCAIEEFDAESILDETVVPRPVKVGTQDNIAVASDRWPAGDIDLSGLWWMRWNSSDSWQVFAYNSFRTEVLVTFADSQMAQAPDEGTYPMKLQQFGQRARHWAYSSSRFSSLVMWSHSRTWDPNTPLTFTFLNSSFADIESIGPFVRKGDDQWLRPNQGGKYNYMLTRVVLADGTPHPQWWPQFKEFMSAHLLRVWSNDDSCARRCELNFWRVLAPQSSSCRMCALLCGSSDSNVQQQPAAPVQTPSESTGVAPVQAPSESTGVASTVEETKLGKQAGDDADVNAGVVETRPPTGDDAIDGATRPADAEATRGSAEAPDVASVASTAVVVDSDVDSADADGAGADAGTSEMVEKPLKPQIADVELEAEVAVAGALPSRTNVAATDSASTEPASATDSPNPNLRPEAGDKHPAPAGRA